MNFRGNIREQIAMCRPSLARTVLATSICILLIALLTTAVTNSVTMNDTGDVEEYTFDREYPGTAVRRMLSVRERVRSLSTAELHGEWSDIRRRLLWAGGLRDLPNVLPGRGYTGHCFNDFNHCDLTTMADEVTNSENNGQVQYVAPRNPLGKFELT
jgi:hypothetical protein